MKARIPPQKRLSRDTLQACADYANSLQDANNVRIFKLSCRVLHEYFGFGAQRITKYVNMLDELIRQNADNGSVLGANRQRNEAARAELCR